MIDTDRFAAAVRADPVPLDLACALVAGAGRPQVDPQQVLRSIDDLAAGCDSDDPLGICAELFGSGRLRGDTVDYYDPRNSWLDEVMARGTGIPITLSILAIEVARRRSGPSLVGVGLPGHFLLRLRDDPDRFVDPFQGGIVLGPPDVVRLFENLHGGQLAFAPVMLAPTSPLDIVTRVLNNLRGAQLRRGDRSGVATAIALQCALPGAAPGLRRELAGALAGVGEYLEAAQVLDDLAEIEPSDGDRDRTAALQLRARMN